MSLDGRNPLLYFSSTRTVSGKPQPKKGIVNFSLNKIDSSVFSALLRGKEASVSSLHSDAYKSREVKNSIPGNSTEFTIAHARANSYDWNRLITSYEEVWRKSKENFQEKNIETLYLVRGLLRWNRTDPGPDPCAPLILIPVSVEPNGRGHTDFSIKVSGEPIFNDALKLFLRTQLSIDLDSMSLAEKVHFESINEIATYFKILEENLDGGSIEKTELIGNFSFLKLPLVADMDRILRSGTEHLLLRALSGDLEAIAEIGSNIHLASDEGLNEISPNNEFLVFPTDRSQHSAVMAITQGVSTVIQGPPGTGKSQTIANAIAEMAAMGKKILFVAEKRAAIDAVVSRLSDKGLGSLVLDLHGEPDKKLIASQLLEVLYETKKQSLGEINIGDQLGEARSRVQKRWASLSEKSGIFSSDGQELTLYESLILLGKLTSEYLDAHPWPKDFSKYSLLGISQDLIVRLQEFLNLLCNLNWLGDPVQHASRPLEGFVRTSEKAEELTLSISYFCEQLVVPLGEELQKYCSQNGYRHSSLEELNQSVQAREKIDSLRERWDVEEFAIALSNFGGTWEFNTINKEGNHINFIKVLSESRRRMRILERHQKSKYKIPRKQKRIELRDLTKALNLHSQLSHGKEYFPTPASEYLKRLLEETSHFSSIINQYGPYFEKSERLPISEMSFRAQLVYEDLPMVRNLPTISRIRGEIQTLGNTAATITGWLEDEQLLLPSAGNWVFRHWLEAQLVKIVATLDSTSGDEVSEQLDEIIRKYQTLDLAHLKRNSERTHSLVRDRVMQLANSVGFGKLRREADKKGAHLPFRRLLEDAQTEVLTLKPCLAMSPLSVSRLLPCEEAMFDVVIFDEASQIAPEDAIPSIYRAKQVVVAGDRYQLGPTAFGRGGEDLEDISEDEEIDNLATIGLESILDSFRSLLPLTSNKALETHYRSQDERLITFSNKAFYIPNNQGLLTFPSREVNPRKSLGYEYVPNVKTKGMRQETNRMEIEVVLEQIIRHVDETPQFSLGVITFGDEHRRRIEDELLRLERENDNYFEFISRHSDTREPFFVKNIERVQGDERDCIIISPGYARGEQGTLRYNFGWLSQKGGERRLNVAASRAKRKMTLVTSISSQDFGAYRGSERGTILFKAFLQFMETHGLSTDLGDVLPVTESPFEEDILYHLQKMGLKLDCQVGDSGYRIDFAVRDPNNEEEYVLAIEADGASYHSSAYARERDIIRQRILQDRGWKFVRIWSTDWFRDPQSQIQKVLLEYKNALLAKGNLTLSVNDIDKKDVGETGKMARLVDERLFLGLRQSSPNISREECLVEWMKLCGHIRRTKKVLSRFSVLWDGLSMAEGIQKAQVGFSDLSKNQGYEFIAWIRDDEVDAASLLLENGKAPIDYAEVKTLDGSVICRAEGQTNLSNVTFEFFRLRNGIKKSIAILSESEIRQSKLTMDAGRDYSGKSSDTQEAIRIDYIFPDSELNLAAPSVKIYRKRVSF